MRRRGSALIIVLLLVSLLVVLSAEITVRSATDSRMLENQLTELQAQYGLQGALVHAIQVLRMDLAKDQKEMTEKNLPMADWNGEDWAKPALDLPLGDGTYGFTITDEQARYPMNALVTGDSGILVPLEQERFSRLLTAACPGIDTSAFRESLYDWLDGDRTGTYEQGARNAQLLTTKELFLLPMATTEILTGNDGRSGLLPKVTRWTTGQVNVNTASREVLYGISDRFDALAYDKLLNARPLRVLDELKPILGYPDADPLPPELAATLSVRSTFFRVALSYGKGMDIRRATAIVLKVAGQPARLWWDPDPACP